MNPFLRVARRRGVYLGVKLWGLASDALKVTTDAEDFWVRMEGDTMIPSHYMEDQKAICRKAGILKLQSLMKKDGYALENHVGKRFLTYKGVKILQTYPVMVGRSKRGYPINRWNVEPTFVLDIEDPPAPTGQFPTRASATDFILLYGPLWWEKFGGQIDPERRFAIPTPPRCGDKGE